MNQRRRIVNVVAGSDVEGVVGGDGEIPHVLVPLALLNGAYRRDRPVGLAELLTDAEVDGVYPFAVGD